MSRFGDNGNCPHGGYWRMCVMCRDEATAPPTTPAMTPAQQDGTQRALTNALTELREAHDELARLRAENQRLTAERAEALKLAYIGEHRFPDLTWKARCEEAHQRATAAESALAELQRIHESLNANLRKLGNNELADYISLTLRAEKAESALPALRERAENAEARLALVAGWVDENAGEHDLPDEVAHWVEVAMDRCDDDGFPIEVKT